MTLALQDNALFLSLGDIDLGLRVKKLFSSIPFRFHL